METAPDKKTLRLRCPELADGPRVHVLIQACPPLELNTPYCYMILCDHFYETCVVAEDGDQLVGFLSAYRKPSNPSTLFVWQVAVSPSYRGCRIAFRMLDALLERPFDSKLRFIETAVSPGNLVSRRLFTSWADAHGATLQEEAYILSEAFLSNHEAEPLLRIGPLGNIQQTQNGVFLG